MTKEDLRKEFKNTKNSFCDYGTTITEYTDWLEDIVIADKKLFKELENDCKKILNKE